MPTRMPVLFVGHGSPMNALADNAYTRSLADLQSILPRPEAILVISAHWLTTGTHVSCQQQPRQIYDFYGFPKELYTLDYPCSGAPWLAEAVQGLIPAAMCNDKWGVDHAAWAVLRHIYPSADVPVVELSLDYRQPAAYHYELGRRLAPLREQGVLILGSGNVVHNLRVADFENMEATFPWAEEFEATIKNCLQTGDHAPLIDYQKLPYAAKAIPTNEHYLPLLYIAALQAENEQWAFFHEGIQNASVSMLCLKTQ